MSRVRRSLKNNSQTVPNVAWILSIVIVCGITLFFLWKHRADLENSKSIQIANSDDKWALPSPKRAKPAMHYPQIPNLPSVQLETSADSISGFDLSSLIAKFQALVGQHPLPEIREGLFNEISTGHIYLSWTPVVGSSAQFQVMPESRMHPIAGTQLLGRNLSPVLDVEAQWIA